MAEQPKEAEEKPMTHFEQMMLSKDGLGHEGAIRKIWRDEGIF